MIMAIVRRQNDVRGSFYKLFTPQGLFSNNCRRGSVFLGFRQQEWRNPYFAITAGGIPQRITPTRGAKYMHVGYAKSTSEKYPCMHHSPMHPPHACHTTTWVMLIWVTEYPCMWLRQSLWRNSMIHVVLPIPLAKYPLYFENHL